MTKRTSGYITAGILTLVFFQLVDYIFNISGVATVNSMFVFGRLGNNWMGGVISLIAIAIIWLVLHRDKKTHWPLAFVAAAALSNLIDRIAYGGVVDYFKLWLVPTFNLADAVIVVGIVIIAIQLLRKTK